MKILAKYLSFYKNSVIYTLVFSALAQIFVFLDPFVFRIIIDKYILKYKSYTIDKFLLGAGSLILLAVGISLIARLCKNLQDYFLKVVTQKVSTNMYSDGINHSLRLSYHNFENQRSGETLKILQSTKDDVERFINLFITIFFSSIVGLIFVFFYALNIHWSIGLVFVIMIPVLLVITSHLSKKIKQFQRNIFAQSTTLAGATTESLRNIEIIKILGLEDQEIARLSKRVNAILKLQLHKAQFMRLLSFIQGTLINVLLNGVLILMFYLIFSGVISAGQFFSLFMYSIFIVGPLQQIATVIGSYRETEISLSKFQDILNIEVESEPNPAVTLNEIFQIRFDNISFNYPNGNNALTSITFEAKLGEITAFVGTSGSGKTSILKLLVGLYKPSIGEIFYNNIPSRDIIMNSLRKKVGFVPQDTQLFSGTLRENMLFVCPEATDEDCLAALELAVCNNFIIKEGLDTKIGENGLKLSGGEKQRLAIARALLRKPAILIFDEATSALDPLTEEEITKIIYKISNKANHLTIIISHRLSTVMHADKIYLLEKGSIVESGSHNELLNQPSVYRAMWYQQTGEFCANDIKDALN